MNVIGLDPGATESSFVELDARGTPLSHVSAANATIRATLKTLTDMAGGDIVLAVEYMRPRGMPTAQEEIDTCVELGRIIEAWGGRWEPVSRMQEKMHVCGRANATDANTRQALIDLYGGQDRAVGGKRCPRCKGTATVTRLLKPCPVCSATASPGWRIPPGPLAGIKGDEWAALAVAVTARARLNGGGG